MDAWQQTVETRLGSMSKAVSDLRDRMDRDFRLTWAGIIGLGLIGAGGVAWIVNLLFHIQSQLGDQAALLATITNALK